MNAYRSFIRPLLFCLPPEAAHRWTMAALRVFSILPFGPAVVKFFSGKVPHSEPLVVSGLVFPNPVGLAAGLDKDAEAVAALGALGFGFVEVGTLTPKPQPGNPQPRLFRLPKDRGLINRMGFNNHGVVAAAQRLKNRPAGLVVGGNIGKNKDTPNELAAQDYVLSLRALHPVVDFFTVNISSPNTPGLRALQSLEPLRELMREVLEERDRHQPRRPVWVKLAPDLTNEELVDTAQLIVSAGADGIIATNTTLSRSGLGTDPLKVEQMGAGGLSGAPLRQRSTDVIRVLRGAVGPDFPLIAVGGVLSGQDAREKKEAGATLVQVYTGLIYEGPQLVHDCIRAWND
ncbi:MAG: quinone-dependent dihydroorotate dehydrogenase [Schleiferiaceae bacterium]|jgi:dihydroorotate dehydrogenase|nr:quinone-dependent dihydroorotate dehydrogenase [Schleiferiaceae bacterium]MDP4627271.1 quinone-dependent dihydroorotate dehydrogenase [Schleiferiaceae bacterium]MDP4728618.1 quinone-dependent dihydroorotate dehydrogenase [Schleiferiaceae bacterium]MDP4859205.1 quinone-dependent dihydroorotate dehydrogenase [Schleiferiaceae bacterium]MDP4901456.1 quinone-dependent dihydroorotate dehydrogenase [Schleiferiaceae bacterium]